MNQPPLEKLARMPMTVTDVIDFVFEYYT